MRRSPMIQKLESMKAHVEPVSPPWWYWVVLVVSFIAAAWQW